MNYSPLRYPGGKTKMLPIIKLMINKTKHHATYIEPFAGGAGVALGLLFDGCVEKIVINDFDKSIYSIWRAILTENERLIQLIRNTPISIDEWHKQKLIYLNQNKKYSLELGFAALYLNRTNRSGILKAGPIGGFNQNGKYLIDVRFKKEELIKRIEKIALYRNKIKLYNCEINTFIKKIIPKYKNSVIYFDPPYFKKGKDLYKNFFTKKDHERLCKQIRSLSNDWIVSYDNEDYIKSLYSDYESKEYKIHHSAANNGTGVEVMFVSDSGLWLNDNELKTIKTSINFIGDTNE
ncbi:MAG TPA: DNA methyltransferase [Clostridiales bacterium]|nr:DNA methyltransferase [Clostridiales bacterium]